MGRDTRAFAASCVIGRLSRICPFRGTAVLFIISGLAGTALAPTGSALVEDGSGDCAVELLKGIDIVELEQRFILAQKNILQEFVS